MIVKKKLIKNYIIIHQKMVNGKITYLWAYGDGVKKYKYPQQHISFMCNLLTCMHTLLLISILYYNTHYQGHFLFHCD